MVDKGFEVNELFAKVEVNEVRKLMKLVRLLNLVS